MDIVEELRKDRENGAKRLVDEYKTGLLSLARRFCHDPGDAEELVNRTFAAVIEGIDGFLEQSSFFTWMCQILVNLNANDNRRKSNDNIVYPGELPDVADEASDDGVYQALDAAFLRDAIDTLPKDIRKTLMMHYFMDFSVKDIARLLAIPVGTAKWRLLYARQMLAVKLCSAVKKPAGKTLLLVLLLCGLTAIGAAIGSALGWGSADNTASEPPMSQQTAGEPPAPRQETLDTLEGQESQAPQAPGIIPSLGEQMMNTTTTTRAAAMLVAATLASGAYATDGIVVTGSAQTDGLLSSLSLSFPASESLTRLLLAWGAADRGTSLGNWEPVDWLADVEAGATSCDCPVSTLHSGLPFVRVFRIVPDDSATELESVTATGTQYVKTGFTPTSRTAVRCDFELVEFTSSALFGARTGAGQNSFCFLTIVPSGNAGHGWRFDYGNQIKNSAVDPVAGKRYLAEADYQGLKIDGTLLQYATLGSLGTVTPGCVMALFGMNTAGGVGSLSKATIYSFKAWSDTDDKTGSLAADLVPCRKNGVVSFYDRVTRTFESNVSGTLVGGAEKAHGTFGTPVDSSEAFNPYGTDRTMTVVQFYRDHRLPTIKLTLTTGYADCALVAVHDSVDHGGSIADWPTESTALIEVPAADTSMTVSIPWRIEDDEDRFFRFFLVARSGATTYDRQFEGIRATGTQYVLTDFVPTQTANVMVDFKFDSIADAQAIFGARGTGNTSAFAVWHTLNYGYRFDYANWNDNSNVIADKERYHVINTYSSGLELDGERIKSVPASAKINFTAPCKMAVFGLNTAGTVGAFAKGVCRYVKAWRVAAQDNTRVLDLLPAMKNAEVGFYNKCDGTFYGNKGTGAFEAVNEVVNAAAQILSDSGTLGIPPPGAFIMLVR